MLNEEKREWRNTLFVLAILGVVVQAIMTVAYVEYYGVGTPGDRALESIISCCYGFMFDILLYIIWCFAKWFMSAERTGTASVTIAQYY